MKAQGIDRKTLPVCAQSSAIRGMVVCLCAVQCLGSLCQRKLVHRHVRDQLLPRSCSFPCSTSLPSSSCACPPSRQTRWTLSATWLNSMRYDDPPPKDKMEASRTQQQAARPGIVASKTAGRNGGPMGIGPFARSAAEGLGSPFLRLDLMSYIEYSTWSQGGHKQDSKRKKEKKKDGGVLDVASTYCTESIFRARTPAVCLDVIHFVAFSLTASM
ncbi:hypothetical protein HD554DRAFT_852428 [Boletus coccyginus]|nr:hypothetical protein HD554DRAFT_852428 [Boletus coccyginus]